MIPLHTAEELESMLKQLAAILRRHETWQKLPWGAKRLLMRFLPEEEQPGVGPRTPLPDLREKDSE